MERYHRIPLNNPTDIPSLVEEDGGFRNQRDQEGIKAEDIAREWEAQILKFIDIFGHKPTHLDSHHGIHRKPHIIPIYFELAHKYGIPAVRGDIENPTVTDPKGIIKNTFVHSAWSGQRASLLDLQKQLEEVFKSAGEQVVELVAHPAYCDDDLIASSSWNTVREDDYKVLVELAESDWLRENDIELVKFPHFDAL